MKLALTLFALAAAASDSSMITFKAPTGDCTLIAPGSAAGGLVSTCDFETPRTDSLIANIHSVNKGQASAISKLESEIESIKSAIGHPCDTNTHDCDNANGRCATNAVSGSRQVSGGLHGLVNYHCYCKPGFMFASSSGNTCIATPAPTPAPTYDKSSHSLNPGDYVTFWSSYWNRFVRINNDKCDRSSEMSRYNLPDRRRWTWESFIVVDGGKYKGHQTYAFWNPHWKRFLRMRNNQQMDASSQKNSASDLPSNWTWERFVIVNAGTDINGHETIALWCPIHNRYMRMNDGRWSHGMDASSHKGVNELPAPNVWTWERFTVVHQR